MRDKKRIKPFMEELTKFWEINQDLRFGQIIYMLAEKLKVNDIFFPEEDKWMKALKELKTPYYNSSDEDVLKIDK